MSPWHHFEFYFLRADETSLFVDEISLVPRSLGTRLDEMEVGQTGVGEQIPIQRRRSEREMGRHEEERRRRGGRCMMQT